MERDGPLAATDAVGWAIRLAKRVEELHRLGVAHGSLSAACVQTEGPGCETAGVLADVRQSPQMVSFHSPERLGGGGISEADDTWAIAVTLYFMVTGQLPFSGEAAAEVRQRIARGAPAPLHAHGVDNAGLQALLDSFLQGDTSRRGTTVAGLREALEKWPGGRNLGPLPALDETEGDLFSGTHDVDSAEVEDDDFDEFDDEDDDEEAGIETVMKDFSEVRAELERMRAEKEQAAAAGAPGGSPKPGGGVAAAAAQARQQPQPFGGAHRPAGVRPPLSPAMPARRLPAAPAAPAPPSAPPAEPAAPPAPAAEPEPSPAARRRESGTPMAPPSFEPDGDEADEDDFDGELATIVMTGPMADEVAAAVQEATDAAAKPEAQRRPLPAAGRPAVRPAAGQPPQAAAPAPAAPEQAPDSAELRGPPALSDLDFDDDEHATVAKPRMTNPEATQMLGGSPNALFDVPPKPPAPPGMAGAAPAPQRALRRPDSEPPLPQPPAPGPAGVPEPRVPGPPLTPGAVRVVPPNPPKISLPLPGSASRPPPAIPGRPGGFESDLAASLPPPAEAPDRLRTWLALASFILALVLAVVGLLWLRRQGIVDIF